MPGMYKDGDYDLAGFTVGAVERDRIITGEHIAEGDIVLALPSSGLHSNGYSLVRKLIESTQGVDYDSPAPFDSAQKLGDIVITPTHIYVKPLLEVLKHSDSQGFPLIKGMANITGGGLTENIPRSIPDGLCAQINTEAWSLPPLFRWLADIGDLSAEDIALTFNCGIGMVVVCTPENVDAITTTLENNGESVFPIGQIVAGAEKIDILNLDQWNKR